MDKNIKMKKFLLFTSTVVAVTIVTFFFLKSPNTLQIPELIGDGPKDKNARWTEEYAQQFYSEQAKIQQGLGLANKKGPRRLQKGLSTPSASYANGTLNGFWKSKGPFNMPGAFQFCEMDEGTDTVYAVTCGHYGGVQFIWKGTLKGDDWNIINPQNPARFDDLIVLPNGNNRRVIAAKQNGNIMYSDNGGNNWLTPSGLPSFLQSTIVNRQDNNVLYTSSKGNIYKSTDKGATFQLFQSFGSNANNTKLYSPRWSTQPGASEVYLARDNALYKLNAAKTTFIQTATIPTDGRIAISGDNRKLWIVLNEKKWHSSTNQGVSFNYVPTTGYWYSDPSPDMHAGQFIGINPENPDNIIGGYAIPQSSQDGGITTNADAHSYWGYYQNSVGNDPKVRTNYHPDFQSNQFFYDKDGKLLTLRSSDGGVFLSYNDFTKTGFSSYADMTGIYYNISLFNKPSQETYRGGFIYGHKNQDHLTCGTQDQGWQDTRSTTYGEGMVSWDQVGGGDGPSCITGDGKIGWSYNYEGTGQFRRFELYNGETYTGQKGTKAGPTSFNFTGSSYFTPSVGDWDNGDRIWILSQSLRRIEYNNGTITGKEDLFGSGSSYMQGIAQSKFNADIVYTMRNGIVYKSTNRGTNWSQVANASETGVSGFSQNRGMGWSSPLDDKIVLFATQSGTAVKSIFSNDGGVTWENVTGSGANLFPTAEVNGMAGTKNGKHVFASTNMGPYVFVVDEKKWYPLAAGGNLPVFWGQIVYCVDYGDKEVVHFSTWGQGVWDFVIEEINTQNNVSLTTLNVPTTANCNASITPKITIKNTGSNTLSSVKIKVYINDALDETINHTTSLTTSNTEVITLSEVTVSAKTNYKVVIEQPNGVVDENPADNQTEANINIGGLIAQNTISIKSASTEETSGEGANNGKAINAIDGDPATFWHSQWTGTAAVMPHTIEFNLGKTYNVSSLRWLHRQNNSNGNTKTANIYISNDGIAWGNPELITIPDLTTTQTIDITAKTGQFVKLVIQSNHPGTNNSSLAEINFYGCEYTGPITANSSLKENITVNIYPNPTTNKVNITGNNILQIDILNNSGQTIKTIANPSTNNTVDLHNYPPGTYLVKVNANNKNSIHKVVKQ